MLFSTIVAAICGIATGLFTGDPAVDLWLTSDEVERLFGEAAEPLYIIQDGVLNPSISPLLLGYHDDGSVDPKGKKLLLPADFNFMKIAWRAPKQFHYTFMELRSSDPAIMGPPLLSITLEDSMPSNDTEFRIDFPCTGERTGIASVSIILRIRHLKSGLDIPASPIHLTFDKECIEAPTCEPRCANRGICNRHGRCDCPAGFFGQTCRIIFCIPHCYNSGTCVAPGVCSCLKGFIGNRCQKAICPNDCSGHGYCYKPGYCYCYHGWTGANCDQQGDNDWLQEDLRPGLENWLPNYQRIVFGDDDLIAGMHYLDAVNYAVITSFKTIILLSRKAVRDSWFIIKFRIVLDHLNDVKEERVILVFLDDIPDCELPSPVRLYLNAHFPNLRWVEEERRQEFFWKELVQNLKSVVR